MNEDPFANEQKNGVASNNQSPFITQTSSSGTTNVQYVTNLWTATGIGTSSDIYKQKHEDPFA